MTKLTSSLHLSRGNAFWEEGEISYWDALPPAHLMLQVSFNDQRFVDLLSCASISISMSHVMLKFLPDLNGQDYLGLKRMAFSFLVSRFSSKSMNFQSQIPH